MQLCITMSVIRAFFFCALVESNLTLDRVGRHSMNTPLRFI